MIYVYTDAITGICFLVRMTCFDFIHVSMNRMIYKKVRDKEPLLHPGFPSVPTNHLEDD